MGDGIVAAFSSVLDHCHTLIHQGANAMTGSLYRVLPCDSAPLKVLVETKCHNLVVKLLIMKTHQIKVFFNFIRSLAPQISMSIARGVTGN